MNPWTREQTRIFISLLKQCPCIYNTSHPDYKLESVKRQKYNYILNEMKEFRPNISPKLLKMKMRTLQGQLHRELLYLETQKSRGNGREKHRPRLWCYDELQFLNYKDTFTDHLTTLETLSTELNSGTSCNVKDEDLEFVYVKDTGVDVIHNLISENDENSSNGTFEQSDFYEDLTSIDPVPVELKMGQDLLSSTSSHQNRNVCSTTYVSNENVANDKWPGSSSQIQQLCEMIKLDLQAVSEELFYDAKWKIMDILRDVQKRRLDQKCKLLNSDAREGASVSSSNQ